MTTTYTRSDVAKHNKEDDLWLIYNGKVYNMTSYYSQHPGGDAMLHKAGKDVSLVLDSVAGHGFALTFIHKKLKELYIGELA
ncbi:unnamed protein product [Bursaphelenchus okinawaensis]|uniref:Cytochrome b5 heme-binding domain-containing protein n=1 Tax=Bursaphelenchus okinawaensis TaxID=465554 RepID=A0A811LE49_9BILA|nr:unnamed protein product [Bursaphelenchus okinawaensis]CAG9121544.1 unnamed protein product [Bursaphelenchus okinawaensis]